jgi:hypothetical protein
MPLAYRRLQLLVSALALAACGRLPLDGSDGGTMNSTIGDGAAGASGHGGATAPGGHAGTGGGHAGAAGAGGVGGGAAGVGGAAAGGVAGTTTVPPPPGDCQPKATQCVGAFAMITCGPDRKWGFITDCGDGGFCANNSCSGAMQPGVCKPSESGCTPQGLLRVCQPDGSWGAPIMCPRGCVSGICVECNLGETQCLSDAKVETCQGNGTWGPPTVCANGCKNGNCVIPPVCVDGQLTCGTPFSQDVCKAGRWFTLSTCDGGCVDGKCRECNPSQTQCVSNTERQVCTDGKWGAVTACPVACTNGMCTACSAGSSSCTDDKHVRTCNDDGKWDAGLPCDNDGVCFNDFCHSCKPGAVSCDTSGNTQVCNSDGEWETNMSCEFACTGGACGKNPKTVFVTSTTYTGALGGVAGADAKCQARATAAGLTGTYLAWLSDFDHSPASRFKQDGGPYVLVTGNIVANNWAGLTSGTLRHAINVTELGGAPSASSGVSCGFDHMVWTDTSSDGNFGDPAESCGDWTDATVFSSWWGTADLQTSWSQACSGGNSAATGCGAHAALFCFQQ